MSAGLPDASPLEPTPGVPLGDRPLKVVMVGGGFVTPYHAKGWHALPGVTLAALQSRTRSKAEETARRNGIPTVYDDFDTMLERESPDIVDICTPPEAHPAQVAAAAARGIHIICQKPVATTLEDAKAMAATAARHRVRLMVHENFRFRVWYREIKRLLAEGLIGRPTYFHSTLRQGGTVTTAAHPDRPWTIARQPFFATMTPLIILESIIHQLDVARCMLGEADSLYAQARRISPHVRGEDMASLMLRFGDTIAVVERSYASRGHPTPPAASENVVIEGEDGALFLSRDGDIRVEVDRPGLRRTIVPGYDKTDAYARSYSETIAHFAACLRSGAAFETDIADNLKTFALTLAAYRSLDTGQAVQPTL